ncbi:MAG: GNAT family N-acetyltransferase [Chitinophagaceae bacterium]
MNTDTSLQYAISTLADIEKLQELNIRAYSQFSEVLTAENWDKLNAGIRNRERLEQLIGKSTVFVCRDGEQLVGVSYFVPRGNPTDVFQEDWSCLRMVGVDPAYRGKGIAAELVRRCIAHAKETGEHTIALHTSEFMDAARHIYGSLGFVQVKELPNLFGKRYWLYLLKLD